MSNSVTSWTVVHQVPLPMRILQAECWRMGYHALLQGIFPTHGSSPGLPALKADCLPAETPRKPKNTGMGSLSFLQGIFPTQESNQGFLHCRRILYQLSYQGSPKSCVVMAISDAWKVCIKCFAHGDKRAADPAFNGERRGWQCVIGTAHTQEQNVSLRGTGSTGLYLSVFSHECAVRFMYLLLMPCTYSRIQL